MDDEWESMSQDADHFLSSLTTYSYVFSTRDRLTSDETLGCLLLDTRSLIQFLIHDLHFIRLYSGLSCSTRVRPVALILFVLRYVLQNLFAVQKCNNNDEDDADRSKSYESREDDV